MAAGTETGILLLALSLLIVPSCFAMPFSCIEPTWGGGRFVLDDSLQVGERKGSAGGQQMQSAWVE